MPHRRQPTLTPSRLAWRQMRARWTAYVPTAIGLAAALALATAVSLTQARAQDAGLVRTVQGLGPNGLVSVRLTGVWTQPDYDKFRMDVQHATGDLGGTLAVRSSLLYSATYLPALVNGSVPNDPGQDLQIATMEDLPQHVDLVAGTWPIAPTAGQTLEVTLPQSAAGPAHLGAGDTECLKVLDGRYRVCIHVAGIWKPRQAADPYWGTEQGPPVAAFTDDSTYFANLVAESKVDQPSALVSVALITLSPKLEAIRTAGAAQSLARLRSLHAEFGVARPDAAVVSNLELALDQFVNESSVAAYAIELVVVQLLLIALYCGWFLAGLLLAQQRHVISIWRSRGWSWIGVTSLLFAELAATAAVGAPLGLLAGWVASEAVARFAYPSGSLPALHVDWQALGALVGAVLLAELALIAGQALLAARHSVLSARIETSRPQAPWWRRRHVDLILALLAVPLLAEMGFAGSASVRAAAGRDDPLYLLVPGLASAFFALALLRALAPLAALLARVRSSMAARLASMQLLRAPGQHAGLATLLMLAIAIGVFASAFIATAKRNGADRAAYSVGSDVRATLAGVVSQLADDTPLGGAGARSAVFRGYGRVAGEDSQLLGVDPYTFEPAMYTRPDLASMSLASMVQRLADAETGGLLLPAQSTSITVWVHGGATGGSLTADLSDAHGKPARADLGSLDFTGWKELSAPLVAESGSFTPPLRFRDLAIAHVTTAGDVALSSLAAGNDVLQGFDQVIEGPGAQFFPGLWWISDWTSGSRAQELVPSMDLPRAGAATVRFSVQPSTIPAYIRPEPTGALRGRAPASLGAIPAIASAGLLDRFGLKTGDLMQVEVDHVGMTAVIVGVAEYFPTLYPQLGDFIVMERDPLLIALAYNRDQRPFPNEIWARVMPGQSSALIASMQSAPGVVTVIDRWSVEQATATSPQQLELESILVLGFVAALALGLLAFALHFVVLTRSRLADYAVLEANGMPQTTAMGSMVVEQAVLLSFCTAAGSLLGVVAAAALLPTLQLGTSAGQNVPPTIVAFDGALLAIVLGAVVVAAISAIAMIAFAIERPNVMAELRAMG
ncbi:MAG TPA: FtsX-like permease family protein [Candidatus Dormibacteraeota bacterium]|nr:FtsX-like permease family protein [Candidatus Dormibacteraeota bacterium]